MVADRFHTLARDLRAASFGRGGNPPGISRFSVGSLGGRIHALARHLPPPLADEAVARGERLGTQDGGLAPEQTVELADWLERAAAHARAPIVTQAKGGVGGGPAA